MTSTWLQPPNNLCAHCIVAVGWTPRHYPLSNTSTRTMLSCWWNERVFTDLIIRVNSGMIVVLFLRLLLLFHGCWKLGQFALFANEGADYDYFTRMLWYDHRWNAHVGQGFMINVKGAYWGVPHPHGCPVKCIAWFYVGMLGIQLALERRPVPMEETHLEYSECISLRRWSSSVLLALMTKILGKCTKKWWKIQKNSTNRYWCFQLSHHSPMPSRAGVCDIFISFQGFLTFVYHSSHLISL